MSARRVLSLLVPAVLLAFAPPADATKFAAEFLKIGVGARALGMGGTFVALADDATAGYWNPAGLAALPGREVQGMHAEQFGDLENHDVVAYADPFESGGRRSALGVTFIRLSVDDIQITRDALLDYGRDGIPNTGDEGEGNGIWDRWGPGDQEALDASRIRTENSADMALLFSYAREMGKSFFGGANVKILRQDLVGDGSSFGFGADLGALWVPSDRFSIGAALRDATTTQLVWDTGRRETVVPTFALGMQYTREVASLSGVVTLAGDVDLAFEDLGDADQFAAGAVTGNAHLGAEYWFRKAVAVRVGSDSGDWTAGAGFRAGRFGADYAFLSNDTFDTTHRLSGIVRF
jgi:hypothetical protein